MLFLFFRLSRFIALFRARRDMDENGLDYPEIGGNDQLFHQDSLKDKSLDHITMGS